ncbi:type II secretion system protein [candidate division WOR-3 bacterium]|nr:type II secretion system protein [candidate division WOR-3 bacterium]
MKKGFSLIELMVVVVIIGILAAIAIPNFIRLRDRAKESEVKANAHTCQLAAEEYSTTADGNYCDGFATLTLPSNIKNPFAAGAAVVDDAAPGEGEVSYQHGAFGASAYTIVGGGKGAVPIITLSPGQ